MAIQVQTKPNTSDLITPLTMSSWKSMPSCMPFQKAAWSTPSRPPPTSQPPSTPRQLNSAASSGTEISPA